MANRAYCSDGSRVSELTIKRRYEESKREKYEGITYMPACEGCGHPSVHNDHTIAKARCKVIHKTELIWHKGNYVRSCEKCHHEWEGFKSGEWTMHHNVEQRLRFLKEHDPEGYQIRVELTMFSIKENISE